MDVLAPQGGFYMFPDFERFREPLAARNINDSETLCKEILSDTGVAILPGSAFLKESNSLTARLAFVNFDGASTLSNYDNSNQNSVSESFVKSYCQATVAGTEKLCSWLNKL